MIFSMYLSLWSSLGKDLDLFVLVKNAFIFFFLFFSVNGTQSKFNLSLPVFVNKFFESTSMDSQSFFQRWKNLSK